MTTDLGRRVNEHNSSTPKSAKYTRGRRPVKLAYSEEFDDMSLALRRERQVKKFTRVEKEKLINQGRRPKREYNESILINPLEIKKQLSNFSGWKTGAKKIYKQFIFKDFVHAIKFVNELAVVSEKTKHHPDINIRYNKVKLTLSTHDAGGVTTKDIDLAKEAEKIISSNKSQIN